LVLEMGDAPTRSSAAPEPLDTTEGFVKDGREAWLGFLVVHSKITRRLDALLVGAHGMTLNEYEVLLKLDAAGGTLRMSELAEAALLSRSGLTRIVDDLEAQGLIARTPDPADGRVLRAILTDDGRARLRAARDTHLANIHSLFLNPLRPEQRKHMKLAWQTIEEALLSAEGDAVTPARSLRRRRRSA
jgi:DNA-binding MarR family transcriptional regulator